MGGGTTKEVRYREAESRLWASLGVFPTEQRIHLDRTSATIRIQEAGEGPPVVFVHGGSINGTSWAPLVAHLDGFRCILLDRPGCGLSPPLATSFADASVLGAFADSLVVDVLDALGLEGADVVATSFGGYIALRSAAAHPDRIGRMVEFGYAVGAPIAHTPLVMRLASAPMIGRLLVAMPPTERTVRMIFRQIGLRQALEAGRVSQEAIDWFLALLRDTNTMRNELDAGPPLLTPIRGMNVNLLLPPTLLATIGTPIHFLWGEEDPFGGPEIAREFVGCFPNAELELMAGAGHAVWMDDAERAAKTTAAFLGR